MKKFFLVVVGVVGLGLAIRFTLNRPHKPKTKPVTPAVVISPPSRDQPEQIAPTPSPPIEETPVEPPKPAPPRIAGSIQISDTSAQSFAVAPGVAYYCESGAVMAAPKTGGDPQRVADCDGAFDFTADAQGVLYCSDHQLLRVTTGTQGSHVVADNVDCIMSALDGKYAYYVVPGFDGVENPGVYRVARAGGVPEKIFGTRPKEQFMLAVDDDALWIGSWSAGTISKLAKTPGAKPRTVVTGQKGIVDLAIDGSSLYWYAEGTGEIRRRKKTGGAVEVIGHDVDQEPIEVADGHAYWFEGKAGEDKRLMHLAPGAGKAEQLAAGLKTPSLRADSEGVYVTELDRDGIFMFKR